MMQNKGVKTLDHHGSKRYQEWRRFDATALPLALDGFNRLFQT